MHDNALSFNALDGERCVRISFTMQTVVNQRVTKYGERLKDKSRKLTLYMLVRDKKVTEKLVISQIYYAKNDCKSLNQ